ncbi:uncharacterized protein C8Q71DRAFT_440921 [Rhodofomes roseus]|uniref:Uncharacterized protein n=1 Tax=Rhodofomes roseus TaxID=34475 RepID=A0ABQ8KR87_9APHY|nr:uncharacterized protein C8Q71DRAFT_440921 [Rhodofomes roseus]KAH9841144.1 hypothetical protein C8Q71DRAFT_440921 [Rhodofomes roseus]
MSTPKSSFESLISTTSIADDAHLHAALSKYFYPIFDTLPAKCSRSITAALQSTEKEYQLIRGLVAEVDLEGRKRMFETDIEAAEASQDLAVWTATEKKWATAVGGWLVALWQLGVEKGCERPLVRECLVFCEEVIRRLVPPPDIADEWNVHRLDICIKDSTNYAVFLHYDCPLAHGLAWLWMELLAEALVSGDSELPFVRDAVAYLQWSSISRIVQAFLGVCITFNEYIDIEIDNNAIEFSILHWSKCKTQKLPELRLPRWPPA